MAPLKSDRHCGAYRSISKEEAVKLEAAGEAVEWAEGCGWVVYDERARVETQIKADLIAAQISSR